MLHGRQFVHVQFVAEKLATSVAATRHRASVRIDKSSFTSSAFEYLVLDANGNDLTVFYRHRLRNGLGIVGGDDGAVVVEIQILRNQTVIANLIWDVSKTCNLAFKSTIAKPVKRNLVRLSAFVGWFSSLVYRFPVT